MIKKVGNIPRNVPKSVLVPKHQTVSGFYTIADCVKMQILSFFFFYYLHKESGCLMVAIAKVKSLISDVIYNLKTDNKGAAALLKLIVYLGEKVTPHLSLFISINSELVTQFSLKFQCVHSSWLWQ